MSLGDRELARESVRPEVDRILAQWGSAGTD
jgi:hypothetical protein